MIAGAGRARLAIAAFLGLIAGCATAPPPNGTDSLKPPQLNADGSKPFRLDYRVGCLDLGIPPGWTESDRNDAPDATRFVDQNKQHERTFTLTRYDANDGTSARDWAVKYVNDLVSRLNAQTSAQEAENVDANVYLHFKPEDLDLLKLGQTPNAHQAAAWGYGYTPVAASSVYGRSYDDFGYYWGTVTTTLVPEARAVHQNFFFTDRTAAFRLVFKSPPGEWSEFRPIVEKVEQSLRFSTCGA